MKRARFIFYTSSKPSEKNLVTIFMDVVVWAQLYCNRWFNP